MQLHMKMIKKIYLLLFSLLFAGTVIADDVSFQAVAPDAVVLGERFQLKYVLSAEGGSDLRVPALADFDVLMGPSTSSSMSMQMVNGKTTRTYTITYTYVLLSKKEGTFTIPPATVKVKGANYQSNSLSVRVLPQDKAATQSSRQGGGNASSSADGGISNDGLFVRLALSKSSAYEQEGILATLKLYTLYDMGLENVKLPEFEGFMVQEIELPQEKQWTMEHYDGRNYRTVVLKQVVLFPQRSGKITIEPGKFETVVRVRTQQQTRSIFDDFFNSYQDVKKTIYSPAVSVDVKPLPFGKPASFAGSAGSYTMTADISSEKVKADESVTIRVKIIGEGNIKLIKNPTIEFPSDFEVYDPKVSTDIKVSASGVKGSKSIEFYAIPRYDGEFDIPPIEFSYFDLKSNSYKTLKSQPFHLTVEKGEGGSSASSVVANYSNKEQVRFLGEDIRYLKTTGFSYHKPGNFFFGSVVYWLWYIIPALLSVVCFVIFRKKVKENSDIALQRTKKANKVATKRLKNAASLLRSNQKEAFYEELHKALWGYISDKLNIPFSDLTKESISSGLETFGVGEELISEFVDILNTCEYARFAPVGGEEGMSGLFERASKAIGKMENIIKR